MIKIGNLCIILMLLSPLFACDATPKALTDTEEFSELTQDQELPGNFVIHVEPETKKIVKNPMMGWAIYCDAYNPDMQFWDKFDNISVSGSTYPVRASDYASILYIRWPWSAFEKAEGEYAWNYDAFFRLLEKGAAERGLKLAFRIYVDSRDYSTCSTPDYVRAAGAKGSVGNTNKWSPYPDDPVFQEKYAKFLQAFASRYDDPDKVDFIDGFGLGKWGEGHSIEWMDSKNYAKTFDWITNLYLSNFKNIQLAINYHKEIGETLLNRAFEKGYVLRHDAFGMGLYYGSFEKGIAATWFPRRPILAESGWWQNGTTSWMNDPNGYKTWADVWKRTLQDALDAKANMLDLRNISETKSWFETSFDQVLRFVSIGGYRLYPDRLSLPRIITGNSRITVSHRWNNAGVGVCPNNAIQWNQKYKVAFALLDKASKEVKKIFVDQNSDPSQWIMGTPVSYSFSFDIPNIANGNYLWAVAIVDTTKGNVKGINLSAKGNLTSTGWLPLFDVTVK